MHILLLAILSSPVLATESGVVITCNKDRQELRLQYDRNVRHIEAPKQNAQVIRLWDLLKVKKCPNDHQFAGDLCEVTGVKTKQAYCRIGGANFQVTIKPQAYNPSDLMGECGAAVTGSVIISKGSKRLVEEILFEQPNCQALHDENSEVITEIKVKEKDGGTSIIRTRNPF